MQRGAIVISIVLGAFVLGIAGPAGTIAYPVIQAQRYVPGYEAALEAELKPGTDAARIEPFFQKHGFAIWPGDGVAARPPKFYSQENGDWAAYDDRVEFARVTLHVRVDTAGRVSGSDVIVMGTGP